MVTFKAYQSVATKIPVSPRNDGSRIHLPVSGLQEAAGKVGTLLTEAFSEGRFSLTELQREMVKDQLSDMLWYLATLGQEAGIDLELVARHGIEKLNKRSKKFDPDQR